MALSKLKQDALKIYKASPVASWILGLTTGLLITAIISIDLLLHGITVVTFPLLILPIVFSGMISHIVLKAEQQVTVLLFSIIIFLSSEMLISFVASSIFATTNSTFVDTVNQFYELLNNMEVTMDDFLRVMYMNGGVLFNYICVCFFPSFYLAVLSFIYHISRSSISAYYRIQAKEADNRFIRMVYSEVRRKNGGRLFKDYLSLNWPLFILLTVGFAGGVIGGYFWKQDIAFMFSLSLIGSALMVTFFLPFYFANQEAIFEKYSGEYDKATATVTSGIIEMMQRSIDLTTEEKERIENSFEKKNNPLEDEKDESNKKDSDEP